MPIASRRLRQPSVPPAQTRLPAFPASLDALRRLLPTDAACLDHLERTRWPGGFVCPRCGQAGEPFRHRDRPLAVTCRHCRRRLSLVTGTPMARSHLPLTVWFQGAFLAVTDPPEFGVEEWCHRLELSRPATASVVINALHKQMAVADRTKIGAPPARLQAATMTGGRRRPMIGAILEVLDWRPAMDDPDPDGDRPSRGIQDLGRLRLSILESAVIGQVRFIDEVVAHGHHDRVPAWLEYRRDRPIADGPPISMVVSELVAWLDRAAGRPGPSRSVQKTIQFQFRFNRRRDPWCALHDAMGLG